MEQKELVSALQKIKVQTGSMACLGCDYENSCGIKGCAIIRAAIEEIEEWGKVKKQLGPAVNQQESDEVVHHLSADELPPYHIW